MNEVHKININNKYYPQSLKLLKDAPKELYVKGNITEDTFNNCVSVVGTRNPTEYGYRITSKLVTHLNINNLKVVSGFMYGIDNAVHRTCVANRSPTIAVLPFGINKNLSRLQQDLLERIILNNGLVVSEYPNMLEAKKWMFIRRNRIVSALSKVVVLIEGSLKSGTITTAEIAVSQNKKVYAVCGHIDCEVAMGVNSIIKKGKATLLDDFNEIVKLYYQQLNDNPLCNSKSNNYSISDNLLYSADINNTATSKVIGTHTSIGDDKVIGTHTSMGDDKVIGNDINTIINPCKDITINPSKDARTKLIKNERINPINDASINPIKDTCTYVFDSLQEKDLYLSIKKQSLSIDQIMYLLKLPLIQVTIGLTSLEVKGLITDRGGIYHAS